MPQATIYLDNATTSFPKPPGVAEAMIRFMTDVGASPGRASYHAASESGRIMAAARLALTRLLDGGDPQRRAGVEYVNERGIDAIAAHERGLIEKLIGALAEDERFVIYGPRETERRVGTFSFTVDGLSTADAGAILDTS